MSHTEEIDVARGTPEFATAHMKPFVFNRLPSESKYTIDHYCGSSVRVRSKPKTNHTEPYLRGFDASRVLGYLICTSKIIIRDSLHLIATCFCFTPGPFQNHILLPLFHGLTTPEATGRDPHDQRNTLLEASSLTDSTSTPRGLCGDEKGRRRWSSLEGSSERNSRVGLVELRGVFMPFLFVQNVKKTFCQRLTS